MWTERADRWHSDEGKALIQVLIGGAALQESEGDKVELPLQNQNQLPVPAHGAAGVHQTLQGEHKADQDGQASLKAMDTAVPLCRGVERWGASSEGGASLGEGRLGDSVPRSEGDLRWEMSHQPEGE